MPTSNSNSTPDVCLSTSENTSLGRAPDLQWTLVLDAVPEGISVHAPSGEILWANKALCEIYTKPLSLLSGLNCEQVFHGEGSSCKHEQVIADRCAMELENEVEVAGRVLSVRIGPILDEQDQTCGFIRVMRDVTGERRARAQLLNTERLATLGQVLFGIAHDVGTPLNIISGYSEFLLMRATPQDQGHKELSSILQQARRIALLFAEVLELARGPQSSSNALDINGILTHVLDLVGHHLRKAEVKAVLTCTIRSALIYGEAPQLKQAFVNLVLNAAEQVGIGGKVEIVIDETTDVPGFVSLSFWGTGANGLGHDFSQSLVRLFTAQRETEPVGIGLSLAKEILDKAGARITSSEVGARGGPLIVHLPVKAGS